MPATESFMRHVAETWRSGDLEADLAGLLESEIAHARESQPKTTS